MQENQRLKQQLEVTTRTTKRRRVEYDPQDTFASIVEVRAAQIAIGLLDDTEVIQTPPENVILPNQVISAASILQPNMSFQNMQHNWQIDPDLQ